METIPANDEVAFVTPSRLKQAAGSGRAVLAFTRLEHRIIRRLKPEGREEKPIVGGFTRLTVWPDMVLAGPILGAPLAAMVVETLGRAGVRDFLSLGWCGALRPGLGWGDIVLPEAALSEEGVSAHYPVPAESRRADPDLAGRLEAALGLRGLECRRGEVWTTDAPFRETRSKVAEYGGRGILAVDMETSAVMSVAAYRGWRWAGLMVVSDELWPETWRPGFHSEELKNGLEAAAGVLLAVIEELKVESR